MIGDIPDRDPVREGRPPKMMHPHTALRMVSPAIGYGVFATNFIPKGSIVYAKDAMEIQLDPDHPLIQDPLYRDLIEKYSYIEPTGVRVISWDIAKYVNHCCQPSTLTTGYGFELAIRDLEPGDEITDDYGIFNSSIPMRLVCEQSGCRRYVRKNDIDRCHPEWDRKITDALTHFRGVDQPLLPLTDPQTLDALGRYLDTGRDYRSVYLCKFKHRRRPARPTAVRGAKRNGKAQHAAVAVS